MPEVLVHFDEPQQSLDGRMFVAQVYGARTASGVWEGWIEFHPRDGGEPACTARETEQLTRGDLRYWAAGLTNEQLSQALIRALHPERAIPPAGLRVPALPAASDEHTVLETTLMRHDPPKVNPAEMLAQRGEHALKSELRELDGGELRDIVVAFDIPDSDVTDLARTFEDALVERIVAWAQQGVVGSSAAETTASVTTRK